MVPTWGFVRLSKPLLHADRSEDDPLADRAIDSPKDHVIPDTIGEFRVIREIGRGGMGIVYEAQQHIPSRRVALKLVRPEHPTKALARPAPAGG